MQPHVKDVEKRHGVQNYTEQSLHDVRFKIAKIFKINPSIKPNISLPKKDV